MSAGLDISAILAFSASLRLVRRLTLSLLEGPVSASGGLDSCEALRFGRVEDKQIIFNNNKEKKIQRPTDSWWQNKPKPPHWTADAGNFVGMPRAEHPSLP